MNEQFPKANRKPTNPIRRFGEIATEWAANRLAAEHETPAQLENPFSEIPEANQEQIPTVDLPAFEIAWNALLVANPSSDQE